MRPYRLYIDKETIPHACYAHAHTCLEGGARRAIFELHVGKTLECVNQESGRLLGWFKRDAQGKVSFSPNVQGSWKRSSNHA